MKEKIRDNIQVNQESKLYYDTKICLLDIIPKDYCINIHNNENKPFNDRIFLKNMMDFPVIIVIY